MIGSNSLRSTLYGADYDIQTILKGASAEKLATHFQDEYAKARANPNIFITEFKCGLDPRLQYKGEYTDDDLKTFLTEHRNLVGLKKRKAILAATGEKRIELVRDLYILRWTAGDIKNGRIKLIDGTTRSLADCLMDKTICKIDVIQLVGNQFAEFSENYRITMNGRSNFEKRQTRQEMEDELEEDIKYYSKIDSFKSLKRLFSLYKLEGDKKKMKKMITFFNSQVGYLNKIRAELDILLRVLDNNYRKPKWEDIVANTQFIKEQISSIYKIPFDSSVFKSLDDITEKNAVQTITLLKEYFAEKINNNSKDFLRLLY